MQKPSNHSIISIIAAAIIAMLFLIVVYYVANYRIPLSAEKAKLQLFEKIRAICLGEPQLQPADSVVMIDVHYDKEMVVERDEGLANGMFPVTNREKLLKLLSFLNERKDYRYIVLDVFLEKNVAQERDTALYRLINQMPRIVIAKPLQGELADSGLLAKAGTAQYGTAIWENDFVKFSYMTDSTKSMPLMMYEELTGRTITKHWGNWYTDRGLSRKSVILTYEFCDEDMIWDLGTGLLGDTIDGRANAPELHNLDTKGKYILIGDFEGDRHQTFFYDMSGTTVIYNAFLTLLHQHHIISCGLILAIFVVFWILAWLTITQNQKFEWLCSFFGIPSYLFILSLLIYLIAREAYDVLVATALFWILKGLVALYIRITTKKRKRIKYMTMKRLFIITLLLAIFNIGLHARRLTIIALKNCTSIKVDRKILKVGDSFQSWQTVYWSNARQLILVKDEIGRTSRLTHKGFEKYKAKSPDEFFLAEQALGTRSYGAYSKHYTRRDYYLTTERTDTLLFPITSNSSSDMRAEAVWTDAKQHEIVTPINTTSDGKFYIVSPMIWKGRTPQNVILTIRECSSDGSWTDNIYQGLHIVVIP